MKQLKKINRDILLKCILKLYDNCHEYCLVDVNNQEDIYFILEEEEVLN